MLPLRTMLSSQFRVLPMPFTDTKTHTLTARVRPSTPEPEPGKSKLSVSLNRRSTSDISLSLSRFQGALRPRRINRGAMPTASKAIPNSMRHDCIAFRLPGALPGIRAGDVSDDPDTGDVSDDPDTHIRPTGAFPPEQQPVSLFLPPCPDPSDYEYHDPPMS